MGHVIDIITLPSSRRHTAEDSRLLASISEFKKAVSFGRSVVIRDEFYYASPVAYQWAYERFAEMVSSLRSLAMGNPGDFHDIVPVYREIENGDEAEEMQIEYPSHIDGLPHRIVIRNRYNPF